MPEELTWEIYRDTLVEQAEQGVDYFTIHAGVRLALRPADREAGDRHRVPRRLHHGEVVPRASHRELPLHALPRHLRDHAGLRRLLLPRRRPAPGVGGGRERRGAVRGAGSTLGELTGIAWEHDVQVMIEGPGHVPMQLIKENMEQASSRTARRRRSTPWGRSPPTSPPATTTSPRPSGPPQIGWYGTAMLCYVTPKEHLGLPNKHDVREGIITYKIAAHAADLAKGHPGSQIRDKRALEGPLRVPVGGPVQPRARPRAGARVPRRDPAPRTRPRWRTSARCAGRSSAR